jgi:hypothetical protein
MKRRIMYGGTIFAALVLSIIVYQFLFGKLFPYSPVIVGFSKSEMWNTVVYIQKGAHHPELEKVDALIPEVEKFHEMKFIDKPRIFFFKDEGSYYQRSITKARFCAFYNGDVVVSPWAMEEAKNGVISLDIYLLHELSHSLIFQHSGIWVASRYPEWLLEWVAVYSAQQMGTSWYPSKDETYEYIRNGSFLHPRDFKTDKEDDVPLNVKYRNTFMYSEFACIVDYLIEGYGKEKLLRFMKKLTHGGNGDVVFEEIYGFEFGRCIREFRAFVCNEACGMFIRAGREDSSGQQCGNCIHGSFRTPGACEGLGDFLRTRFSLQGFLCGLS